jgi:O-antigen ligase
MVLAWIARRWQGESPIRLSLESWGLCYLGISLLSLIGADYPRVGLGKWGYYHLTGILLGYAVAQSLREWGTIERLARGIALIASISAAYALFSHLLGRDYLWGEVHALNNPYYGGTWRLTGPFGNSVSTATYLVLCLPLMLWQALFCARRTSHRLLFLVPAMVTLVSVFFTQSRGGWLALGAALLLAMGMLGGWGWQRMTPEQRWTALMVLLLGVSVGAALLPNTGLWRLFEPQVRYMEHRAELLSGPKLEQTEPHRLAQYRKVLELLRQHPFFGIGFGNFTRVYESHREGMAAPERAAHVHTTDNMYLMFAAETGILGLLAALALLARLFHGAFSGYRLARGAPAGLLLAFLAGGGGFLANMFTWDPLNDPTLRIVFWILAGTAMATARFAVRGV